MVEGTCLVGLPVRVGAEVVRVTLGTQQPGVRGWMHPAQESLGLPCAELCCQCVQDFPGTLTLLVLLLHVALPTEPQQAGGQT